MKKENVCKLLESISVLTRVLSEEMNVPSFYDTKVDLSKVDLSDSLNDLYYKGAPLAFEKRGKKEEKKNEK